MVSSPYYDNQYWEYHLPVNPPIEIDESLLPAITEVSIMNWAGPDGLEFRPRLRDNVQWETPKLTQAMDDAPELDVEYDCD